MATLYRPIYLDPIGSDTDLKDGQADVSYTPILSSTTNSSTTNRESEGILARNRTLGKLKAKQPLFNYQTSKDGKLLTEGKEQPYEGEGQLLLLLRN